MTAPTRPPRTYVRRKCPTCGLNTPRHAGECLACENNEIALPAGGWVPNGRGGVVYVIGADPAPWQITGPTPCGTRRGYELHKRRAEAVCGPCRAAYNDDARDRKREVAA